jgi:hypothetical protein
MCCSFRRWLRTIESKFLPATSHKIVEIGLVCNYEFAWITHLVLFSETAPPNNTAFVLLIIVNVCPKRALGISPSDLTLQAGSLFI